MSCSLDVNILLVAANTDDARQPRAFDLLRDLTSARAPLYLAWQTLFAFVRMATHPGILRRPLPSAAAHQNVAALLGAPNARVITEQEGFWDVYGDVTRGLTVRGRQVPDAHLAALLRQHGVRTLYTADPDFKRFAFLDVVDPL